MKLRNIGIIHKNWTPNKNGKKYTHIKNLVNNDEPYVQIQDCSADLQENSIDILVCFDEEVYQDGGKRAKKVKLLANELKKISNENLFSEIKEVFYNIKKDEYKVKFILSIPDNILTNYLDGFIELSKNLHDNRLKEKLCHKKYESFFNSISENQLNDIFAIIEDIKKPGVLEIIENQIENTFIKKYQEFFNNLSKNNKVNLFGEIENKFKQIKTEHYKCKFLLSIPEDILMKYFDDIEVIAQKEKIYKNSEIKDKFEIAYDKKIKSFFDSIQAEKIAGKNILSKIKEKYAVLKEGYKNNFILSIPDNILCDNFYDFFEIVNIKHNFIVSDVTKKFRSVFDEKYKTFFETASDKEVIKEVKEKINLLNSEYKKAFISLIPNKTLVSSFDELFEILEINKNLYPDIEKRFKAAFSQKYDAFFKIVSKEEGLKEINKKLNTLPDDYKIIFIETIPFTQYFDDIFSDIIKISDNKIKSKISNFIKEKDETLYSLLNANYYPSNNIKYHAFSSDIELKNDDVRLAKNWTDDFSILFNKSQMLSARLAEKAAKKFYESLGYKVDDISIQQLSENNDGSWKTHDLSINGNKSVDVKNARTPLHNDKIYVEHTVRKFKQDRNNRDVVITGVLSKYIVDYFNVYDKSKDSIIFLGEITRNEINKLEKDFCKNNIIDIEITNSTAIPPYLFDYPEEFYKDIINLREKLKSYLDNINENIIKYFEFKNINLIAVHLMAGMDLPDILKSQLTHHEKSLYEKILKISKYKRISLPELYLTVLTDFLDKALTQQLDDSVNYKKLLEINYSNFLSIQDPLGLLNILCSTLKKLVENKESLQILKDFDYFKFSSIGILRGRNRNDKKMTTIFAYCGGRISGKGKCGHNPLIYAQEKTCEHGYLICPEEDCGYCCPKCKNTSTDISSNQDCQSVEDENQEYLQDENYWLSLQKMSEQEQEFQSSYDYFTN